MCYLTNKWIAFNLPINVVDYVNAQVLSNAISMTSFYMCVLDAYVKNLLIYIPAIC